MTKALRAWFSDCKLICRGASASEKSVNRTASGAKRGKGEKKKKGKKTLPLGPVKESTTPAFARAWFQMTYSISNHLQQELRANLAHAAEAFRKQLYIAAGNGQLHGARKSG